MSAKDLRKLLARASEETRALNAHLVGEDEADHKRNKYNAQRIESDGMCFGSKREYWRYMELRTLEARGDISDLEAHPTYTLVESFRDNEGNYVSSITYTPDFRYVKDGKIFIEDVKGDATKTEAFRIRWRLLQSMMRDNRAVRLRIV